MSRREPGPVGLRVAVLLVRRNLRLGRGDRRGAFRLCLYLGTMGLLFGTLRAHHVADLAAERELFVMLTSWATYGALVMWVFYIALEPHVRAGVAGDDDRVEPSAHGPLSRSARWGETS